jgi:hypothetical protein
MGTEQVERIVFETFPTARIARMDVDTTGGKWAHAEILGRVERREVDLLLGTQMIAKGLDFPNVTLVGVINADVGLHLPDFRASERTFQLLSQVAGRAGRGALGGEVIVQTSVPDHYAIQAALRHDYEGFAARELKERTEPWYPPHLRLANVVVSSPDPELAAAGAEKAVAWIVATFRQGEGRRERSGPEPRMRRPAGWRWWDRLPVPSNASTVGGAGTSSFAPLRRRRWGGFWTSWCGNTPRTRGMFGSRWTGTRWPFCEPEVLVRRRRGPVHSPKPGRIFPGTRKRRGRAAGGAGRASGGLRPRWHPTLRRRRGYESWAVWR